MYSKKKNLKGGVAAIIYDETDAELFKRTFPSADWVITLTPNAAAALVGVVATISSDSIYSNFSHLRVLVRLRNFDRFLEHELKALGLSPALEETLWNLLRFRAAGAGRVYETLGNAREWLIPGEPGHDSWRPFQERNEVFRALLDRISRDRPLLIEGDMRSGFTARFQRLINRISVRVPKKSIIYFFDSAGMRNLIKVGRLLGYDAITFQDSRPSLRNIKLSCKRGFLDRIKKRTSDFFPIPEKVKFTQRDSIGNLFLRIPDSIVRVSIEVIKDRLLEECHYTVGLREEMRFYIKKIKPNAIILNAARWFHSAVLAEIAQEEKVPVALISHGSHPAPIDEPSRIEHLALARGLLFSRLANFCSLQTPNASAGFEAFKSETIKKCQPVKTRPLMWAYRTTTTVPPKSIVRRILHAGTYKFWNHHRPWIFETSDEYVQSLLGLVEACSKIPDVLLTIRTRNFPECSVEALRKLLPKNGNFEIKETGEFLDDLLESQLLVSFSSTTIEEALQCDRPVLLWGGDQRYLHLPASPTPPTAQSQSSIYTVSRYQDLRNMIECILKNHSVPAPEKQGHEHVWGPSALNAREFIEKICIDSAKYNL